MIETDSKREKKSKRTMDIPIITTQTYFDDVDSDGGANASSGNQKRRKKGGSLGKYEFKGSQSHRCSLVAVCEAEGGKTTVKWSSVKMSREGRKASICTKTNSANGGLSLSSPTNKDLLGKEVELNVVVVCLVVCVVSRNCESVVVRSWW